MTWGGSAKGPDDVRRSVVSSQPAAALELGARVLAQVPDTQPPLLRCPPPPRLHLRNRRFLGLSPWTSYLTEIFASIASVGEDAERREPLCAVRGIVISAASDGHRHSSQN